MAKHKNILNDEEIKALSLVIGVAEPVIEDACPFVDADIPTQFRFIGLLTMWVQAVGFGLQMDLYGRDLAKNMQSSYGAVLFDRDGTPADDNVHASHRGLVVSCVEAIVAGAAACG